MKERTKKKIRKALMTSKLVTTNRAKTLYRWARESIDRFHGDDYYYIDDPTRHGEKKIFFPFNESGQPGVSFAPAESGGNVFINTMLAEKMNFHYAVVEYNDPAGYMIIDMWNNHVYEVILPDVKDPTTAIMDYTLSKSVKHLMDYHGQNVYFNSAINHIFIDKENDDFSSMKDKLFKIISALDIIKKNPPNTGSNNSYHFTYCCKLPVEN